MDTRIGSGFTDANGKRVTVGDAAEYEGNPGKLFTVTDITQDGDVQLESRKGKIINAKWRQVCKYEGPSEPTAVRTIL